MLTFPNMSDLLCVFYAQESCNFEFWQTRWHRISTADTTAETWFTGSTWYYAPQIERHAPWPEPHRTAQMSTQCSRLSQTRGQDLRRDIINVKHPNSQPHSSTSFSQLVDFLWVCFCSKSVNTAALPVPHGESPELLYKATFFFSHKSRTSLSIFVTGSRGLRRRMGSPSISFAQPIHNSHSPTGN